MRRLQPSRQRSCCSSPHIHLSVRETFQDHWKDSNQAADAPPFAAMLPEPEAAPALTDFGCICQSFNQSPGKTLCEVLAKS